MNKVKSKTEFDIKVFFMGGSRIKAWAARDFGKAGERAAIFFAELASNNFIYVSGDSQGYIAIIKHKDLGRLVAYKGDGEDLNWKRVNFSAERTLREENPCLD